MKETDKLNDKAVCEEKPTQPELDYEALWKEAKYTGETKESER